MARCFAVLLLAGSMFAQVAPGGSAGGGPTATITGQIQTATSGAINHGTLTFTLSQPAVVVGTASVVTQAASCFTSSQGNIVGLPDPVALPVLSTNDASGSLPVGTYYVELYYINSAGAVSGVSPESVITLTNIGTLTVGIPQFQPSNASGYGVAIGLSSGGETTQGTVTGFLQQYNQATPLLTGTLPQPVNTSSCNLYFSDQLEPTGTYYTVNLINRNGAQVAGFPQTWCTYGGAGGTINVSQGAPTGNCNTNGVFYPTPIFSNLSNNGTQSINTPIDFNSSAIFNGSLTTEGATALDGASTITAYNFDNFYIVDGVQYPQTQGGLQNALNAAAVAAGGWVIVPPGANINLSSTVNVGSTAAGTSAHLFIAPGAQLTIAINSTTTDAIQLSGYSTLECGLGAHNPNGTIHGVTQAGTVVRTVVAADQQNGSAEAIYVKGCQFSNLTVNRAVIDASATFANTRIEDNILYGFIGSTTAPGILISAGTGATGAVGPILVENNWVNPGSNTTGIFITGDDPASLGDAPILKVTLLHNQIEHTGTASMLVLNGDSSNLPEGVTGVGNWFLPSSTVGNNYKIVDVVGCQQCMFTGTVFAPVAVTANPVYGFYLESTIANGVVDFRNLSPSLNSYTIADFYSTYDNFDTNPRNVAGIGDFVQLSATQGNREFLQLTDTGTGIEISSSPAWFGGNAKANLWGGFGLSNPGQTTGYSVALSNPAANRTYTVQDVGGAGNFGFNYNATNGVYQSKRGVAGCTTGSSAGNSCGSPITVTWPTAFADTNYSVTCTGMNPTNVPSAPYIAASGKAVGSVTVNYFAITAAAASYATVDCIAVHD